MRKKAAIVLAIFAAAMLIGGCGSSGTSISSEVAQADPWEEFSSLEAAEEEVGFELTVPDMSQYGDEETYSVCAALSEIEIAYGEADSGTYIRKAADDGDISGDYEEYAFEQEAQAGEYTVTLKGESEGEVILAVWNAGDYSYCVRIADGVSSDIMSGLAAEVQ